MHRHTLRTFTLVAFTSLTLSARAVQPPAGFTALFNGKDLSGWWGASTEDPRKYKALSPEDFKAKHAKSLEDVNKHWSVQGEDLVNDGKGLYLTTEQDFGDYELVLDYKTVPLADSGIYLKGVPQVQIWDYTEKAKFNLGADKGSGGLWNNRKGSPGKDPLVLADKPFGEWNHFRIIQVGARTTVWLNDKLVVDHALLENYFDQKRTNAAGQEPLLKRGPIQLQTHGGEIRWRNVFIREISGDEANKLLASKGGVGFQSVFNGKDMSGWKGAVDAVKVENGAMVWQKGKGGTPHTEAEYGDFMARFEFKLPPGGNNGLAIRYPGQGDTAYVGMCELQILDDNYDKVRGKIDPRQAHGSAYGMVAAYRGYQRPIGEWNFEEITVKGSTLKVELNGNVILDCDLSKVDPETYMAKSKHPGATRTKGHFGFAGHSDPVEFRNISIKKLD